MDLDGAELLGPLFERHRGHLRAVAYRMLGSLAEADDAVQEAWLRLQRSGAGEVTNLGGWLTTVVARICLDLLRSRTSRREEPLGVEPSGPDIDLAVGVGADPEAEALAAESVGIALLVVLDRLAPAERVAFVLHDVFGVPFNEIGAALSRSPAAARQLASRARRRLRGGSAPPAEPSRQRELVTAFLAAAREGSFEALLALLDPDIQITADGTASPGGTPLELRGASLVARQALAFATNARWTEPALVDGRTALLVAPHGRLATVLAFTVRAGRITRIDVVADPERLRRMRFTLPTR